MKKLSSLINATRKTRAGFTMIELLIVISILGILATAVLSAINPVEQINRGRDTGTRSDAEQLISAIDRFNAFKGYLPWQWGANDTILALSSNGASNGTPTELTNALPVDHGDGAPTPWTPCHILNKLSVNDALNPNCLPGAGTEDLKTSFVTRVTNATASRALWMYNSGTSGSSTYICFVPQSKAFKTEAEIRCGDIHGGGMPNDLSTEAKDFICAGYGTAAAVYTCLP